MPVIGFLNPASSDGYAERLRGSARASRTPAMSSVRMSRSNTIGARIKSIGCRRWRLNWFAAMSP